jgi:acetylornithine deacetylase/succinyl-diaminopimelate desuccinylase-like protein
MGLLNRLTSAASRSQKIEKEISIVNRLGLHARPAAMFVRIASRFRSEIWVAKEAALIRGGGSIPIVTAFRDLLGAETLLLGLGLPDCRMHSPNENFPLENLESGIRLNQVLLRDLG